MASRFRLHQKLPSALEAKATELFEWLSTQSFPMRVEHSENIEVLRMLLAAGLIEADIPAARVEFGIGVVQPPATVTKLTREGLRWRERRGHPAHRLEFVVGVRRI